ncbi:hypothetical protein ACWEOE_28905 [Amycolatopsis sp. NPDC004368]
MSDNNFRQELKSPETGNPLVVGSPSEAARLRAAGWTEVEQPPSPDAPSEAVTTDTSSVEAPKPRAGAKTAKPGREPTGTETSQTEA